MVDSNGAMTATSGTIGGFVITNNSLGDTSAQDLTCVGMIKDTKLFTWSTGSKCDIGFGKIQVATGAVEGNGITVYAGSSFNGHYILHGHSSVYSDQYGDVAWQGSDKRYKNNINNLSLEFSKKLLLNLQPREFEFNDSKGKRYGFIAQEVRKVLNDMGCKNSKLEYETEMGTKMRQLNYLDLIAPITMCIQDLYNQINELKDGEK